MSDFIGVKGNGLITIKAPKYDMYEFVELHWNGAVSLTKIVGQWYRAKDETWLYETTVNTERLFPENAFEHKEELEND